MGSAYDRGAEADALPMGIITLMGGALLLIGDSAWAWLSIPMIVGGIFAIIWGLDKQ